MHGRFRLWAGVVLVVCTAALAFGVGMSVLHGSGGGFRAQIGNVSAPWLLLPLVAGTVAGEQHFGLGALVGGVASLVALIAFYVSNIYVLGFTGHPWPVEVGLALRSGTYFIRIGLVSGPVFGALGTVGRRRHSVAVALLAAGLFVFEPLAWLVYFWSGPGPDPLGMLAYPAVWVTESIVGLVACSVIVLHARRASVV
ncbi:MAG: hypothetical protein ABSF89_12480 [Acidimicrobiales bacterium]